VSKKTGRFFCRKSPRPFGQTTTFDKKRSKFALPFTFFWRFFKNWKTSKKRLTFLTFFQKTLKMTIFASTLHFFEAVFKNRQNACARKRVFRVFRENAQFWRIFVKKASIVRVFFRRKNKNDEKRQKTSFSTYRTFRHFRRSSKIDDFSVALHFLRFFWILELSFWQKPRFKMTEKSEGLMQNH